jgi:hypothetical protein
MGGIRRVGRCWAGIALVGPPVAVVGGGFPIVVVVFPFRCHSPSLSS